MSFVRFGVVCVALVLASAYPSGYHCAFAAEGGAATVTSVEPDKLKQHMPEQVAGLKRGEVNTQKMSMGDTAMTIVEASFSKEDDASDAPPSADLTYCDYGSNSPTADAAAGWSKMHFSRESDSEYEKTTKVQDFPALENYNKEGKTGTMTIFVGGRILVTLNVTNLSPEQMRKEADALPLKKLAELK